LESLPLQTRKLENGAAEASQQGARRVLDKCTRGREKCVGCNNPKMKGWEDITRMFNHGSTDAKENKEKRKEERKEKRREKSKTRRKQETKKKLKAQKSMVLAWSKRRIDLSTICLLNCGC
jgi:hypothetical protein